MSKHTNETYLEAIRKSDPVILKEMYKDFYPSICRFVLDHRGTREDANDNFADVLEALLRKVNSGHFTLNCKLGTFLNEVGARLWLKKLRRKKFDAGVTTDDPVVLKYVAEMEQPVEETERYVLYREKFATLKDDCQQVLRLGVQEGRSHEEVSEQLQYSYDYSRKKRSLCLKELLTLIKSDPRYRELAFPGRDDSEKTNL